MSKQFVKVYRLFRFLRFSSNFKIGGKKVRIVFSGGSTYPDFQAGSYVCVDPEIQEALEKSEKFNKVYFLESSTETIVKDEKPKQGAPSKDSGPAEEVNGVRTVQAAREYLIGRFEDIKASALANKAKVIEAAKSKNIVFPNLPVE